MTVGRLKARGVGIVYISHRLQEVFDIADRITVLKDGQRVSTVEPASLTMDGLIRLMVGRPLDRLVRAARRLALQLYARGSER